MLYDVKLDLHKFARECGSSPKSKIAPQQQILSLKEKRNALVTADHYPGQASDLEFLRSSERVLAAKQLLLELKSKASQKNPSKKEEE